MNTNDPELPLSHAPWTEGQVHSLNGYQACEMFHPFTCAAPPCRGVMVAMNTGWVCPLCLSTQGWAHRFMAEGVWRLALSELGRIRKAGAR